MRRSLALIAFAAFGTSMVSAVTICNDECPFANDGTCQDGGDGSIAAPSGSSFCAYGTDCTDCGVRGVVDPELGLSVVAPKGDQGYPGAQGEQGPGGITGPRGSDGLLGVVSVFFTHFQY